MGAIMSDEDFALHVQDLVEKAIIIRDQTHTLDIDNNSEDRKIFDDSFAKYIEQNEDLKKLSYTDSGVNPKTGEEEGDMTIGFGFNMERGTARSAWNKVLGNEVSFDDAFNKKLAITKEQAYDLYKYDARNSESECKRIYGNDWFKFKANERMMIMSSYYNLPALVDERSQFYKNMKAYTKNSDQMDLEKGLYELKERSNGGKSKSRGIQKRRTVDSTVGDSPKCTPYLKPKDYDPGQSQDRTNYCTKI